MAIEHPKPSGPPTRGYERRDANAAWIFAIIIFLFVFGISIHFILSGFQAALKRTPPPADRWQPAVPASAKAIGLPGPRLQVSPQVDLQTFRAREDAELRSYGWINRTSGIVRIPIDRAMDLVLQQGLPTQSSNQAGQPGPSSYQLMLQRPEHRQPEIQGDQ